MSDAGSSTTHTTGTPTSGPGGPVPTPTPPGGDYKGHDFTADAKLPDSFDGCDLTGATFTGMDLRGKSFVEAHLSDAALGGADLRGCVLRGANLSRAKMAGANIESADLRSAILIGADLTEAKLGGARLVGARLRGADLTRASLAGVSGLIPGQLPDTVLLGVTLPEGMTGREGLDRIAEHSKNVGRLLITVLTACAFCCLTILTTGDASLLRQDTGRVALPIVGSQVPVGYFFWIGPALLTGAYVYLLLAFQRLWEECAEMPAVFPDGRRLDQATHPWLVNDLVCTHLTRLRGLLPPLTPTQSIVSRALVWWATPVSVLLFWARYLRVNAWAAPPLVSAALFAACIAYGETLFRLAEATLRGDVDDGGETRAIWLQPVWVSIEHRDRWRPILLGVAMLAILLGWNAIPSLWPQTMPMHLDGGDLAGAGLSNCGRIRFARAKGLIAKSSNMREMNLRGFRAPYASMSHADLRGADLSQATMPESDLSGALLCDAPDSETDIPCRLVGTHLENSVLTGARMYGSDMTGAHLRGSDMKNCQLEGASLVRADLRAAEISGAKLSECDLTGADLSGAGLQGLVLCDATIDRTTKLSRTDLRGARLPPVLTGVVMDSADLRGAVLQPDPSYDPDVANVRLSDAVLTKADLRGVDLCDANLSGAVLGGADLRGTALRRAIMVGAKMVLAVTDAATDLTGANLSAANLARVRASGGNFTEAKFSADTNLRHADLRRVKGLTQAQIAVVSDHNKEGALFPPHMPAK